VQSAAKIFHTAVCVKDCPKKHDTVEWKSSSEVGSKDFDSKAKYDTKNVLNYCFPTSTESLPADLKVGW